MFICSFSCFCLFVACLFVHLFVCFILQRDGIQHHEYRLLMELEWYKWTSWWIPVILMAVLTAVVMIAVAYSVSLSNHLEKSQAQVMELVKRIDTPSVTNDEKLQEDVLPEQEEPEEESARSGVLFLQLAIYIHFNSLAEY